MLYAIIYFNNTPQQMGCLHPPDISFRHNIASSCVDPVLHKTYTFAFTSIIIEWFPESRYTTGWKNGKWRTEEYALCQLTFQFLHEPPCIKSLFYICPSYTALLRCRGFHFTLDLYTIGRTPWTNDRPVGRPLPKYRTTQTQNKHAHTKHPCPK
jgi:hypothetical protein